MSWPATFRNNETNETIFPFDPLTINDRKDIAKRRVARLFVRDERNRGERVRGEKSLFCWRSIAG